MNQSISWKWGVAFGLLVLVSCGDESTGSGPDSESSSTQGASSQILASSGTEGNSSAEIMSSSLVELSSSGAAPACAYGPGQVVIAAAGNSFQMGSDSATWLATAVTAEDSSLIQDLKIWGIPESPIHTVQFTYSYRMDTTEITQGQMECAFASAQNDSSVSQLQGTWQSAKDIAGFAMGSDYAAFGVTMEQAALYANARSKLETLDPAYTLDYSSGTLRLVTDYTANGYRLPSEAEWEYAARGGASTDYYWGKSFRIGLGDTDSSLVSENAIWIANSGHWEGTAEFGPQKVATRKKNSYGLYDMIGNVSEWCNSSGMDGYPAGSVTDPLENSPMEALLPRGGNWANDALSLRVSSRTFNGGPTYPQFSVGLRLVRKVIH